MQKACWEDWKRPSGCFAVPLCLGVSAANLRILGRVIFASAFESIDVLDTGMLNMLLHA